MSQIYKDNIKRPKLQDIPLRILKIHTFYNKNLVVQGRVQLEQRSLTIKVGVETTC